MNDERVLIPSFEVEKRTRALGLAVWGFVGVISMFSVGLGVDFVHVMLVSMLNITGTVGSENLLAFMAPIMAFGLLFGVGLYHFLLQLLRAYVITPEKIIKGRIMSVAAQKGGVSLATEAALTAYMIANIGDSTKVNGANGMKNMMNTLKLISLNMEEGFAQEFFFTELYKRKEYQNPTLVKETARYYLYDCEGKKVKIRKLYTGMDKGAENAKAVSILKRVLVRALLVFVACSAISAADLAMGYATNDEHLSVIAQDYSAIEAKLAPFGYQAKEAGNRCYFFEKEVSSERTSRVEVYYDAKGRFEGAEIELYYNTSSTQVAEELNTVLHLLNAGITQAEIDSLIADTQSTIQGDPHFSKIETATDTILLGTSSGHAHIHN